MALAETTTRTSRGPWVWPRYSRDYNQRSVSALLWTLHDLGGVVESSAGRAGSVLLAACEDRGTPIAPRTNPAAIWSELEEGGIYGNCIHRDKRPKRTDKITLLLTEAEMPPKPRHLKAAADRTIFVQPVASAPEPEPAEPEPAPVPPEPQPEPVEDIIEDIVSPEIPPLVVVSDEPIDVALSLADGVSRLVQALLVQGAEPKGESSPDAEEQAVRLAQMIEENNRLRRKVNDLTETVRAKGTECEGLHKALRVSEANLKTLRETVAGSSRERDLARLNGNQRFIAAKPEPAILRRGR